MKLDLIGVCLICGKRRGGASSHASCSQKLQKAALIRQAKPSIGRGGVPNKMPNGLPLTVEQRHRAELKQTGKQYGNGKNSEYWKKFD